jgi:hypothetical protein
MQQRVAAGLGLGQEAGMFQREILEQLMDPFETNQPATVTEQKELLGLASALYEAKAEVLIDLAFH